MLLSYLRLSILTLLCWFSPVLPLVAQVTRYVSTTGTNTDPTSATSWATSTTNLQGAIDASAFNDNIWVADGLYKPTTTTGPASRSISFSMKAGGTIHGGFAGNETRLNQRPTLKPDYPHSRATLVTRPVLPTIATTLCETQWG